MNSSYRFTLSHYEDKQENGSFSSYSQTNHIPTSSHSPLRQRNTLHQPICCSRAKPSTSSPRNYERSTKRSPAQTISHEMKFPARDKACPPPPPRSAAPDFAATLLIFAQVIKPARTAIKPSLIGSAHSRAYLRAEGTERSPRAGGTAGHIFPLIGLHARDRDNRFSGLSPCRGAAAGDGGGRLSKLRRCGRSDNARLSPHANLSNFGSRRGGVTSLLMRWAGRLGLGGRARVPL